MNMNKQELFTDVLRELRGLMRIESQSETFALIRAKESALIRVKDPRFASSRRRLQSYRLLTTDH